MGISEKKMQIVIDNYFKQECDINTSIRGAFEKGFRIGVKKGQSERSEQKWIPCSERMPEPRVDVLCYTDMREMVGYYEEHIDAWYGRNDFELIVKAWMPLPNPYNGGEKE